MVSEIAKEQMEAYLDHLQKTGRKANTLMNVRSSLKTVLDFMEREGFSQDVNDFDSELFFWLKDSLPQCEATVKRLLRQLSRYSLYHTGKDLEKMSDILWNHFEAKRKFISLEQFERLMAAADPDMRAILLLGSMMGLRRAEIAAAKWEDVRFGKLAIMGKGHGKGKEAIMDIPDLVMDALVAARDARPGRAIVNPNDTHLVQGIANGVWKGLHPCSISRSVSNLGKDIGIDLTAHSLRRLFATTLHNDVGVDDRTLQDLMRHADISTTYNCYIKVDPRNRVTANKGLSEIMGGHVKYSVCHVSDSESKGEAIV